MDKKSNEISTNYAYKVCLKFYTHKKCVGENPLHFGVSIRHTSYRYKIFELCIGLTAILRFIAVRSVPDSLYRYKVCGFCGQSDTLFKPISTHILRFNF